MKSKILLIMFTFSFFLPLSNSFAQEGYTIKEYLEQALPPQEGRRMVLDAVNAVLSVTDTPSNHKLIKKLIEVWDVGPRQISIEAKFVEVSQGALDEIGIEWMGTKSDTTAGGGIDRRRKERNIYIGPGVDSDELTISAATPATYTGEDLVDIDTEALSRSGSVPLWSGTEFGAPAGPSGAGIWIGKATLSGSELFAYLRALEQTSKANLLSAPRVTTLSGQIANIELSNTIPYATSIERVNTDFGWIETYDIDEKRTGIFLEVTPTVGEGSNIISLDLHPQVSEIVRQVALLESTQFPDYLGWPVVDTRSTQTSVTIRSGETLVIGGLVQDDDVVTERKVPLLGDIPFLGNLFRYKHRERDKKNLIIFLTATIISPEGREIK